MIFENQRLSQKVNPESSLDFVLKIFSIYQQLLFLPSNTCKYSNYSSFPNVKTTDYVLLVSFSVGKENELTVNRATPDYISKHLCHDEKQLSS